MIAATIESASATNAGGSGSRSGSSGSAAARITSAASRMNVMTSTPARRNQIPMVTLPSQPSRKTAAPMRTSLVARSPAARAAVHGAAGPPVHHSVAAK